MKKEIWTRMRLTVGTRMKMIIKINSKMDIYSRMRMKMWTKMTIYGVDLLITDSWPTRFITLFGKYEKGKKWYVKNESWHMTHDTWYMTHDTLHLIGNRLEEVNLLQKMYGSVVLTALDLEATSDTWQKTCDMWRVTCDMCHKTNIGWWTFCQHFRTLSLTVWEWRGFEHIWPKDQWLNRSMNHKCGCRTAPTTEVLLNSPKKCIHFMQNDQAFLHMHSA